MGDRVDFSANAPIYDRRHGAVVSDVALGTLWSAANVSQDARVLDIGAGTGRVSIPLATRGCRVTAVDPALAMLQQLQTKDREGRVDSVSGAGSRLPFPRASFDVVVMARLLYLTPDWREILCESARVLVADGCLLHEWGNGEVDEEWVMIREEARRLFEAAGLRSPFHPGARTEVEIEEHLVSLGFASETIVATGQGPAVTLREFLRRLVSGELSYIWNVPDDVRARCLPSLQEWSARHFDLDRAMPMPRELRWTIHRKRA